MEINQFKNTPSFKGVYNNKILLKTLENIADHGASFTLGASFLSATLLKPLAIINTPSVKEENKKIFCIESFASALMKLTIGLGFSIPTENILKKISQNPKHYFKKGALENKNIAIKIIKHGTNLISSIPKSILTVALIPVIANIFKKEKISKNDTQLNQKTLQDDVFINFKGKVDKTIANLIESKPIQKIASKTKANGKNIPRNMSILNDILLTISSSVSIIKSKKIENKSKKPLVLNKIISTIISIFAGVGIDKIIQKIGKNFIKKFSEINSTDIKLGKYLDGINIMRPAIVFAFVYYAIIPMLSAYGADKLSNKPQKQ